MERWKFRKNGNNWYMIPENKDTLFDVLAEEDPVLFADDFDGYLINNIEGYTFELPMQMGEDYYEL